MLNKMPAAPGLSLSYRHWGVTIMVKMSVLHHYKIVHLLLFFCLSQCFHCLSVEIQHQISLKEKFGQLFGREPVCGFILACGSVMDCPECDLYSLEYRWDWVQPV